METAEKVKMERAEKWKNRAVSIQACMITLSLIASFFALFIGGGSWRARVIEEKKLIELEQKIKQRAVVLVELNAVQESIAGLEGGRFIRGSIRVENAGNRAVLLLADTVALVPVALIKVARIDFTDGSRKTVNVRSYPIYGPGDIRFSGGALRPGEKMELPFFVSVEARGLYQVFCRFPLPERELKDLQDDLDTQRAYSWAASSYVLVT